ncbi:MAG: hypothetical protein F4Y86_06410 [Gammaproteobacteria bacterium]|nr:hypothetical protein [Gammaproteobacteria bacterium]
MAGASVEPTAQAESARRPRSGRGRASLQADALGRSMDAVLGNNRIGVVQFDRRGRIVAASDAALVHLRDGGTLRDDGAVLRAVGRAEDDRLQGLIAGALGTSGAGASGGSMGLRRPDAAVPLVLHVAPIAGARRVAALALVVDASRQARIDPGTLTEGLGLTPAEAEVAALVAEGLTPRQAGAASGRGEGTVRWHLHRIFAKLGIKGQAQLVRLVSAFAWSPGGSDD